MKILFDCASDYSGDPKCTLFIQAIYRPLAEIYRKDGHQCEFALCNDRGIYKSDYVPDVMFVWNGGGQDVSGRIKRFKQNGAKIIYSEKAWLPADGQHFYFDTKGVNYASTLTDWKFGGLLKKGEYTKTLDYLLEYQAGYKVGGFPDEDFVFIPLQVQNDSQIVHQSPFKTMQSFIDYVAERIPDNVIYIKPHPAEIKIRAEDLKYPLNCRLMRGQGVHAFLRNCAYVVTINSTVGVEALTYYKPVIVLGKAFYSHKLLTHVAKNDAQFNRAKILAESEAWGRRDNKNEMLAFLHYLIFKRQWTLEDVKIPGLARELLRGRFAKIAQGGLDGG